MSRELDAIRTAVDDELRLCVARLEAEGPARTHPLISRVYRWFRHYLNSSGRRMHGLAVVLAYRACGGRDMAGIYRVAAGFQLYHHHTLVHDDIYDEDDRRRGWPTAHRAFASYLEAAGPDPRIADARSGGHLFTTGSLRRGTIAAFAYGKIGRALSAHMIGEAGFPAPAALDVMQALNWHDLFDNAGQLRDVHHEGSAAPEPQACLDNAWLKTGRLFEVCADAGARLANATRSQAEALKTWAGLSALAYQLQDDMEDLVAESEKGQGRGVGRDFMQRKPTYLNALARASATGADAAVLDGWRGDDGEQDVAPLIEVLDRSGAAAAVRRKVAEVISDAKRALADPTPAFDAADVALMESFTDYFVSPDYWRRGIGRHDAEAVALMARGTRTFEHVVLDIHGLLVVARPWPGELTPGQFVTILRDAGCRISFVTNASSSTRVRVVDLLRRSGVRAFENEVFTAGMVAAHYLRAQGQLLRAYLIGTPVFRDEIERVCGDLVEWVEPECADIVVVSRDPTLSNDTLARLRNAPGARLLATCRDAMFVHEDRVVAGPGPTVERVESALGRSALVVGKPNPYVLTDVMGLTPEELRATLVVGDSLDQDVALGRNAGCRTALMTESVEAPHGLSLVPDFVAHRFDDLVTIVVEGARP